MNVKRFLYLIVFIALLGGSVSATTIFPQRLTCPVCNTEFWTRSVGSTGSGGQDRDFKPIYLGSPALLYAPVTCPTCHFTAYISDYEEYLELTPEMKAAFEDPNFPKIPKGAKESTEPDPYREYIYEHLKNEEDAPTLGLYDIRMAAGFPGWAGFDMLAHTYDRIGKGNLEVGWAYLNAAWAVRTDAMAETRDGIPESIWEDLMDRAGDLVAGVAADFKSMDNEADQSLALAAWALRKAKASEGKDRTSLLAFSILLNRFHGENTRVLEALSLLEGAVDADLYKKFKKAITESINRERHYQAMAVESIAPSIEDLEEPKQKANHLYLCGELYRRLERWEEAGTYYDLAEQSGAADDTVKKWIKEQRALLPE